MGIRLGKVGVRHSGSISTWDDASNREDLITENESMLDNGVRSWMEDGDLGNGRVQ